MLLLPPLEDRFDELLLCPMRAADPPPPRFAKAAAIFSGVYLSPLPLPPASFVAAGEIGAEVPCSAKPAPRLAGTPLPLWMDATDPDPEDPAALNTCTVLLVPPAVRTRFAAITTLNNPLLLEE